MQEKKRVIFLYAVTYSGHYQAAQSVREILDDSSVETIGIDIAKVFPLLSKLVIPLYWILAKKIPWFLDKIWDNTVVEKNTRTIRQKVLSLISPKLKQYCEKLNPDIIVCSHSLPCSLISIEKAKNNMKIPLAAIVTDYGIHPYWLSSAVDIYFVPSIEIKNKLLSWGISESKIKITGIPVKSVFMTKLSKEMARKEIGLAPDLPTLLFMGGSYGHLPTSSIVDSLIDFPKPFQAVVLNGIHAGNKKEVIKTNNVQFHIVGYHNKVHLLMDTADILISKPGGLTVSEAIAKGIPLLIFNPLPAQERENTRYLITNGAAVHAHTITELKSLVLELLTQPERLNSLKEKMVSLSKDNNAAQIIADRIKTMVC